MSGSIGRGLIGAPVCALVAMAGVNVARSGDADLRRLTAAFRRKQDRYTELSIRFADAVDWPAWANAETETLVRAKRALAEQIADLPAVTREGLRAKASVLLAYVAYDWDGDVMWRDHGELLGWSIARDLCGTEAATPPERQARWRPLRAAVAAGLEARA